MALKDPMSNEVLRKYIDQNYTKDMPYFKKSSEKLLK
jgi:hypothetical protein